MAPASADSISSKANGGDLFMICSSCTFKTAELFTHEVRTRERERQLQNSEDGPEHKNVPTKQGSIQVKAETAFPQRSTCLRRSRFHCALQATKQCQTWHQFYQVTRSMMGSSKPRRPCMLQVIGFVIPRSQAHSRNSMTPCRMWRLWTCSSAIHGLTLPG